MFKLKELLDGVIEDILELPAMWARTHAHALKYGRRAPFIIARRLDRGDKRYLRLRTAAFIDILILYAVAQATNADAFGNKFLAVLLQPQNIKVEDYAFLGLVIAFFAFYYTYYVIVVQLPLHPRTMRILTGACLFYSVFCLTFFLLLFQLLFGSRGVLHNEYILRGAIYAFDALIFWRLGSMFSVKLYLGKLLGELQWLKRPRWLPSCIGTAACALVCFAVYALVIWINFGKDGLWPNFHA